MRGSPTPSPVGCPLWWPPRSPRDILYVSQPPGVVDLGIHQSIPLQLRDIMDFSIPQVLSWSADASNPVGAEYTIEEKARGQPLGQIWRQWSAESQINLMADVVVMESRLASVTFPKHGCLYFRVDLERRGLPAESLAPELLDTSRLGRELDPSIVHQYALGPLTDTLLWQDERAEMDLDRGPWADPRDYFRAIGTNELRWARAHAKPRINPRHDLNKLEMPESFTSLLERYLALAPKLMPMKASSDPYIYCRTLSHPDLRLDNIFVDPDTKTITHVIDWQFASVSEIFLQPLLAPFLPDPDPVPDPFPPEDEPEKDAVEPDLEETKAGAATDDVGPDANELMTELTTENLEPDADESVPEDVQGEMEDNPNSPKSIQRARYLHHNFQQLCKLQNPHRWAALNTHHLSTLIRPVEMVTTSWERRDILSFRDSMIDVVKQWDKIFASPSGAPIPCPIAFTPEELAVHDEQLENARGIIRMEHMLEWGGVMPRASAVPSENFELVSANNRTFKQHFVDLAENDEERRVHEMVWPYQEMPKSVE